MSDEYNVTSLELIYNPYADVQGRTFLSFESADERDSYFDKVEKKTIPLDCYLMENDTRTINDMYENLKKYNYARSKNTAGKWVYYFVTGFNYSNTDATTISLKIDTITTYIFGEDKIVIDGTIERSHVDRWTYVTGNSILYPKYYGASEDFSPSYYKTESYERITQKNGKKSCLIVVSSTPLFADEEGVDLVTGFTVKNEYESTDPITYCKIPLNVYVFPYQRFTPSVGTGWGSGGIVTAQEFIDYLLKGNDNSDLSTITMEARKADRWLDFRKDHINAAYVLPFDYSDIKNIATVEEKQHVKYGDNGTKIDYSAVGAIFGSANSNVAKILEYDSKFSAMVNSSDLFSSNGISKEDFIKAINEVDSIETESRFMFYPFSYSTVEYGGAVEDIKRQYYGQYEGQVDGKTGSFGINCLIDFSSSPSVTFYVLGDQIHEQKLDIFTNSIFSLPTSTSQWDSYVTYEKAIADSQRGLEQYKQIMGLITGASSGALSKSTTGAIFGGKTGAIAGVGSQIIETVAGVNEYIEDKAQYEQEKILKEQALKQKPPVSITALSGLSSLVGTSAEFYKGRMEIDSETKKRLWEVFKRYGYKLNRREVLSINSDSVFNFYDFIRSRHYFNYVKYSELSIIAAIPNDIKSEICSIMKSGTTFYHVRRNSSNPYIFEISYEKSGYYSNEKDNVEENVLQGIGIVI